MFKFTVLSIFILICLIQLIRSELIIQPTEAIILRDQYKPFIALCTGQGNTRVVSWRSPSNVDIEAKNHERISVERKSAGLRLRIRNLTENDQGIWKCLGVNEDGISISQNVQINVKTPITFISESIQYAELNSTALIKCRVNANPLAEISWYKSRDRINLISSNYEQRYDGLKINRVSLIDNDIFWCQADVIKTGESKDYQIQVIVAQSITSIKVTCLTPCAVEKRTTTLICEANGMPTPEYSWSYGQNSHLIVNGISKFFVRGNRLIINNVDETDNGRYVCHAFNNYDKIGQIKDYLLNVIIAPVLSPIPEIKMSIDENLTSQRVSFTCRVIRGSMDTLSLQWLYANNTLVQPINGISIENSDRLSELIFHSIHREHHGNYTCLAKNSADVATSIARLLIQYKPVYIGPRTNDAYSIPDHPVIMKCEFDSYPPPVIQWIKNNQMILDKNNPQVEEIITKQIGPTIYETQLTYDPLEEDFGLKFECRADNSRIEKHFFTLRRAQLPGKVHLFGLKPSANSIELTINPPSDFGGLPLLEYIVKYEQIDVLNSTTLVPFPVLSNGSQSINITSLRAATKYRIQIAVRTQAGQGAFSISFPVITTAGKVPQFNLGNISCLISSCLIKWFVEDNGESPISKGEIYYAKIRDNDKEDKLSKPHHIDAQTSEYELKKLKPNTNYSIIVRLFNAAGFSERKTTKKTPDHSPRCKGQSCPPRFWIILAIITSIMIGAIFVFVLLLNFLKKCKRNSEEL